MSPTGADVVAAARRLAAVVGPRSGAIEDAGRLPDDVVAALRDSGVPGLWLPAELGGSEAAPTEVVDAIAALAAADGSTGWCAAIVVGSNAMAAFMSEEGARDVFATPATLAGSSLNPAGRAVATGDGHGDGDLLVTGRWGFGSGGSHADWMGGACLMADGDGRPVFDDEGRPTAFFAFFPTRDATIADTWHTSGLRATASHDFSIEALVVPRAHTVPLPFPAPWPGGPMWRMPPIPVFIAPMAAVALGVARGAIDDLVALARDKTPYRSSRRLAERDVTQSMVARAEAATRSARAFLLDTLDGLAASAAAGGTATMHERAVARLAVVNAAQAAVVAVDLCFDAAGTTGLFLDHPLQRRHRDVHALSQHVALAFSGLETVGRVLFGLEPDTQLI